MKRSPKLDRTEEGLSRKSNKRDENHRDYIRWCFADAEAPAAFGSQFKQ
jgi:hypothetical protein